jgi:16S rRNA (adenine1518-N6/adenine1519-N6)-dimethyltransferase
MEGHRARKRFSQNFLHDTHFIGRIVQAIDPRPGEVLVEIGPGLGAMTAPLLAGAGRMHAVEIDRDLAARLRERYAPEVLDLVEGDALELDWAAQAQRLGSGLRVVGNLPYHISTPLLFALLPIADRVRDQHFMLQREVVERMAAAPGSSSYGRLSAMLQWRYRVERLFHVPAGAFSPPPKVESSIVRMRPLPPEEMLAVDLQSYGAVVTAAFSQRRKTLRNALAALMDEGAIRAAGVDPGARAETLAPADFARLAQGMRGHGHAPAQN